jgi:hypothetical protein
LPDMITGASNQGATCRRHGPPWATVAIGIMAS